MAGINTYVYVNSDPLRSIDPFGLWSPGAHDKILDNAFGGVLPPADVKALQQASRDFDKQTQSTSESYKHCMRLKGQQIIAAITARNSFVAQTLSQASAAAKSGNRQLALQKFGEACHPVMDCSSPEHTDSSGNPKEWNPLWPFGHSPTDSIGNETVNDLTPAILDQQKKLLNEMYNRTFGK